MWQWRRDSSVHSIIYTQIIYLIVVTHYNLFPLLLLQSAITVIMLIQTYLNSRIDLIMFALGLQLKI